MIHYKLISRGEYANIGLMKKNIKFKYILIVLFGVSMLSGTKLYASPEDTAVLEEGIRCVDELYDSDVAIERFREVLVSDTAAVEVKIRACFWLAHTYLFEGEERKAEEAIREIFGIENDAGYDFLSGLPPSVKENGKLMYIFNREKELLAKDKDEKELFEIKEVRQEEGKVQEIRKKGKFTLGKFVVSALMAAAYVVILAII